MKLVLPIWVIYDRIYFKVCLRALGELYYTLNDLHLSTLNENLFQVEFGHLTRISLTEAVPTILFNKFMHFF